MHRILLPVIFLGGLLWGSIPVSAIAWAGDVAVPLRCIPSRVVLSGPESADQLVVLRGEGAVATDVTRECRFELSDPGLVQISSTGLVSAQRDGAGVLTIRLGEQQLQVAVQVHAVSQPVPVLFRQDVLPILTRAGCNSGGCHGKAEGQNGFRLSVFGYDAAADHAAIVLEGRGRRVFPGAPAASLFLQKATAGIPHGGGQKIISGSRWHRTLLRWMSEGLVLEPDSGDPVVEILVEPSAVSLPARGVQQLRVTARLSDGSLRPVTTEAEYQSNQDGIAAVDRDGFVVSTEVPGEAAILVRYAGHVTICRVTRPRQSGQFQRPPEHNFIDGLVWDKLQQLNIQPGELASDGVWLRRVFLDTIGTLPTAAEARQFLDDPAGDKRQRMVERLLERPEYSDYWAQRWSDLLQVDKDTVTPEGAVAMTRWIHSRIAANVPFDQFAREVLTAQGSTLAESPAGFYQVQETPEKLARAVSQLFLGVRLECAQCHHHPFEKWDQSDYFGFAGMFTGVERKAAAGGGQKITARAGAALKHPRTGRAVAPRPPGAVDWQLPERGDWRRGVADWMTGPANPYFSRTLANRIWAHYLGRGLVEPVDDLRATNPASNEPLLAALAKHLQDTGYDLRRFTATVLNSRVYQLSARSTPENALDEQNYSHAVWKPLPAEVLLDCVSQATGVPAQFNGWPVGYRAIQVWDNKLPSAFLEVFGRPARQTVCACERGVEPSIAQALHLMNSEETMSRIHSRTGTAARLAAAQLLDSELIEELYLLTCSRRPTEAELELTRQVFAEAGDRRVATEDLLWTLLNSREFVFNH
ncbi:MAG: DUF1549 and DUF1553 domain-containing protein [Planctomyces sp.]